MFTFPGTRVGRGRFNSNNYSQGTSFPSPWPNDTPFYRQDLEMWFYFDGTRWLSVQVYILNMRFTISGGPLSISGAGTTADALRIGIPDLLGGSDLWLIKRQVQFFVGAGSALNGSNFWTSDFHKYNATVVATTLITDTINSGASSQYRTATTNLNQLLNNGTTYYWFGTSWTKNGTPGPLQTTETIYYRIVAT